MGIVYKAVDKELQRPVAIKVASSNVDRFRREAQISASIRSPYVVAVHAFRALSGGLGMIVMEWIDGPDLNKFIKDRGGLLPENTAVPLMRDVCEGMLVAAKKEIIHRDLKPSNLPDIYSFGATFYHALTGKPPFGGGHNSYITYFKHKTEKLVSPRSLRPELSERICDVIERCLAKAPEQRFDSFAEVLKELQPPGYESAGATNRVVLPDPGNLRMWERELGKVLCLDVTARTEGVIYGTDIYTSDSYLATAAVHAGVLVPGENGTVSAQIVAGSRTSTVPRAMASQVEAGTVHGIMPTSSFSPTPVTCPTGKRKSIRFYLLT